MPKSQDQSLVHRELARRAQDVHRVFNPRDEDYDLIWDSYVNKIPAGGTADWETYKVNKYLREMTNLILQDRQQEAVDEENKRRRDRGEKEMDKWLGADQHVYEGKFAIEKGVANPQVRMEIYKELYVGLVKEYGVERVERVEKKATPTTHEELMNELLSSKKYVEEEKPPIISKTLNTPLEQMNQFQLRKIAREKGIDTTKKSKKDELIRLISQER